MDNSTHDQVARQDKEAASGELDASPQRAADSLELSSGYAHDDLKIRLVIASVVVFAISVAAVHVGVIWFNRAIDDSIADSHREEYGTDTRPHLPSPEPRLQPSMGHGSLDSDDMIALKAEQLGLPEAAGSPGGLLQSGWQENKPAARLDVSDALLEKVAASLAAPVKQPQTQPTSSEAAATTTAGEK